MQVTKWSRRAAIAAAMAGIATVAMPAPAGAQDFPNKPITIVVTFGPGTANDIIARHAEAIKTTIVEASNQGVGQGPRAFAPLGRFISTEMPDLFMDIFHQIPVPVLEGLADGNRFAWAEIYAEAARIPGVDAVALRAAALRFYDAIIKPADFHDQRRAELLFQRLLDKYPESDKIGETAYQLGDIYEKYKPTPQYQHAAVYFERSVQWNRVGSSDARMRAAKIYDAHLKDREKAKALYKDIITHDTDNNRMAEARISYGGRGQLTDVQHARYGQQLLDILLPF